MNVRKTPQEEGQPMRARRAVLTGGAVGLAAVAGAALSSTPPALASTLPSIVDWLNVQNAPFNAYGDGVHDDTAAIQAALTAAGGQTTNGIPTGGVVYLPTGVYVTSYPLVIPAQVLLIGAFPASAAMTSKPAVHNPLDYAGSIIQPVGTWANTPGYTNPGVLYVDGGTAGISRPAISNLWVDGSNLASASNTNALAGISVYGGAAHGEIYGVGIYGMPTSGMYFAQDGSSRTDGWTLRDCIVQTWGTGGSNYGIYWEGDDSQFVNVHAQAAAASTSGGSCWYIAAGGNNRWIACRADQSADSGWVFDCDPGGSPDTPGTANMLIGCGTENNANYGLHLINSNASVKMRIPVIAVGCAWGFDGRAAPTNGGAGACVEGYNTLFLDNCNVGTNEASNVVYPEYGLVTNIMGGSAPALIRATGGIWNCGATSPVNDVAAMGFAGGLSIDVHSVTGGMWVTPGVTSTVPVSSTIAPYNNVVSTGAGDVVLTQPSVPPTSGANTTNNTGYDVAVYVTGSGVTKIKVNGNQVLDGAPATVYLRAGDTIAVAWSTLPTWIWQAV